MTLYEVEMEHAQFLICFREIKNAKGNYTQAAAALGIHRNTLSRIMKVSGSSAKPLRREIRDAFASELQSSSGRGSDVLCPLRFSMGRIGPKSTNVPTETASRIA